MSTTIAAPIPKTRRQKSGYPLNAKTLFGVGAMSIQQVMATSLISGVLMIYLTDYAGLFRGQAGAAAAAAATLLVVGRVWDAVNDPILGFLMDRSPRTRWGRFKPFAFIAMPASALLLIVMFNLPVGMSDLSKLAVLYVLYLLFDACFTLMPFMPIIQSLSPEATVRSRLLAWNRVPSLVFAMVGSSFMAVAIALGSATAPNIGLATVLFIVPVTVLSMLGLALVREGRAAVEEEKVTLRDVAAMFRGNKPLWVSQLAGILFGFVWNMMFIGSQYYAKYAFGVENFGTTSLVLGATMILSSLIGVFLIQPFMKRLTPGMAVIVTQVVTGIPLLVLYLLNLAGPITSMPVFFGLVFVTMLGVGMSFIPGSVITLECMDYNKFKVGKTMQGSLNSVVQFVQKLQGAVAAAVTGAVLVSVGYDAAAYEEASTIPAELYGGLGMAIFGVPFLAAAASSLVMWMYPLRRKSDRDGMYSQIAAADPEGLRPSTGIDAPGAGVGAQLESDPSTTDGSRQ